MNKLTEQEKVSICTDIAKNLKEFENEKGQKVNLFNNEYSFVKELKKVFNEYIHNETSLKGSLHFVEINKKIDYYFPLYKNEEPLFVIRIKKNKNK
jgi:hypothetical protein